MKKVISILVIAALTACGGGSSDKSTAPTPVPAPTVNTAPAATNDIGLAQNNQPVVLDVLANDTDAENNSLSISKIIAEPTMGSVEIVNNTLVYTPNKDVALVDTLQYELSDGELTSTASVAVTVNHTISISGKVTDSPISSARVSATLSGETFTTTADNEGNYKLDLTISSMTPELLVISAIGSEDKDQQNVELIAVIGETTSLLTAVADNRELPVVDNSTNITHVSSATYLLSVDRNENEALASMDSYMQFVSELDSNELMSTAGFIKLLVDNDDFDIPNGKTTLSLLENNNAAVNTADAITNYLLENDLLGEDGQPTTVYVSALSAAIAETLADPDVVEQFTADMFNNKTMIQLAAIKEGWLPYSGDALVFSDNGYTIYHDANVHADKPEIVYTRSIVDGKLRLKSNENKREYITIHASVFTYLVENYGFSQQLENELVNAYETGRIASDTEIDILLYDEFIDYTLISSNDINYQVAIEKKSYYQFDIPEGANWSSNIAKSETFTNNSNGSLIHTPKKHWLNKTLADINGRWLLYFDSSFIDFINNFEEATARVAKIADVNPSTTTATVEGKAYNVGLADGVLSLTSGSESYKYQPIQASSNAYFAIVEKWSEGKLEYVSARQIAKFENNHQEFVNNLSTELPIAHLAYTNGSISSQWQGDRLKLDNIYGYQFSASGNLRRGISAYEANSENELDQFDLGDDRWTWNSSGNGVNLNLDTGYTKRHRTWQVISVDSDGYALIFEQSTFAYDYDGNGTIDDDEIGQFIRPRLNIIKQVDLSSWAEAWQNTLDMGLITQAVNTDVKSEISFKSRELEKKLLN